MKKISEESSLEKLVYDRPGFLISRLHQMAVSVFLEEMTDFDITPKQYGTLVTIAAYPGTDQVGVASRIGNDRATIGGIVDRLTSMGLIDRQVDPNDKRTRKLFLTKKGSALLAECAETMGKIQDRLLEPLSASQQKAFVAIMRKLVWHHNDVCRVPIALSPPSDKKSACTKKKGSGNR